MGIFRKEIRTSIDIEAPSKHLWRVITDFNAYPEWNTMFRFTNGHTRVGERLEILVKAGARRSVRFTPLLLCADEGKEYRWRGNLLLPGIFDGEHAFEIEGHGDGHSRFHHSERFSGLLVPLLWKELDTDTRKAFEGFNRALKERVERLGSSRASFVESPGGDS
jgi:hypothetical protein